MTLISVLKVVEEAICDKGQRASCRESGGGDEKARYEMCWREEREERGPWHLMLRDPPSTPPWTRGSVSPVVVKRRCLRRAVEQRQAQAASKTSSL